MRVSLSRAGLLRLLAAIGARHLPASLRRWWCRACFHFSISWSCAYICRKIVLTPSLIAFFFISWLLQYRFLLMVWATRHLRSSLESRRNARSSFLLFREAYYWRSKAGKCRRKKRQLPHKNMSPKICCILQTTWYFPAVHQLVSADTSFAGAELQVDDAVV